ncbi:MAG: hypothetical protein ABIH69_07105 [bacterium]|nr:hypothetical protein [Candidatus Margulisiibacteriota bacterium]
MKKIVVSMVLVALLLTTSSWAKVGRFTLGALMGNVNDGRFSMLQGKYGLEDNIALEARIQLGTLYSRLTGSANAQMALISYEFDIGREKIFPYVDLGYSFWTSGGSSATNTSSIVGGGGVNFYLTDRVALFLDVLLASIGSVSGSGVSLGGNFTF